jgi:hypothetical protein
MTDKGSHLIQLCINKAETLRNLSLLNGQLRSVSPRWGESRNLQGCVLFDSRTSSLGKAGRRGGEAD